MEKEEEGKEVLDEGVGGCKGREVKEREEI